MASSRFTVWVLTLCLPLVLLNGVPAQTQLHVVTGSEAYESLGKSLDGAVDVNNDGFDDFVIGAPDVDGLLGEEWAGAVYVRSGLDGSLLYTFYGADVHDHMGDAVAGAGDVNDDGYADVIAGAYNNATHGNRTGMVRVYSGFDGSVLYEYVGDQAGRELGWDVDGAGDIDGDGFADFMAGQPNGGLNGRVLVYSGVDGSVIHTLIAGNGMGRVVAGGGDVDDDGRDDIIVSVGAPIPTLVRVYSGLDGTVLYDFDKPENADYWGAAIAHAGDIDQDGHADVIVGAYEDDTIFGNGGMARVLSGADGQVIHSFYGHAPQDRLGQAVDGAGDVNGDGWLDLVVGSPFADSPLASDSGRLHLYSGEDGSLLRRLTSPLLEQGAKLGLSAAGAGDLNGDGYADVLGGSPTAVEVPDSAGLAIAWTLRYEIEDVEPDEIVFNSPVPVSLIGHGFENDSPIEVTFGGVPAQSVTWVSAERVDCLPPVGLEDTEVEVVYSQQGLDVVADDELLYGGTTVLGVWPPIGAEIGGEEVIIYGKHFVDDGSLEVTFANQLATILEISPPDVLVVSTPALIDISGSNVTVTSSAGTDTKVNAYISDEKWVHPRTGIIAGGTILCLEGEWFTTTIEDMSCVIGTQPAEILSVAPGKIEVLVPPVDEATGNWLQVRTFYNGGINTDAVQTGFMYTPYQASTSSGGAFLGIDLAVTVTSGDGSPADQSVTYWIADPSGLPPVPATTRGAKADPATGAGPAGFPGGSAGGAPGVGPVPAPWDPRPANGPVGTLFGAPLTILFASVPAPFALQALEVELGTIDPFLIGTSIHLQGLVTGDGTPYGTLTNVSSFTVE